MTRLLPFASSIALAVSLSAASSQEVTPPAHNKEITGEWQAPVDSKGMIARMTLAIFRDGTYVKRVVFVKEYGWTAEGDTLFIAPSVHYGNSLLFARAMAMQMRVNDSALVMKSGSDSLKFHRFKYGSDQFPLVGRWQGRTELGEELIADFTADGRLVVSITLTHEAGRYSVNNDVIEWWQQTPTPDKRREHFEVDENKLKVFLSGKIPRIELTRTSAQLVAN